MTVFPFKRRGFLAVGLAGLAFPGSGLSQSQSREVEGGIGGTGIVGILSEFGSLIIAGKRVIQNDATGYQDAFGPLRADDLKLGDNLTIEASGPLSALTALRVTVTNPLVGVVAGVADGRGTIIVNGTRIDTSQLGQSPDAGQRVTVAGLWKGDRVVASAVRPTQRSQDLIAGTAERGGGQLRIGAVPVRGRGRNAVRDGSYATAIGRFDSETNTFIADQITRDRFQGTDVPLERLAIEGYLEPQRAAPGFRVSGLGHSFKRNLQLAPFESDRVLFDGPYDGLFEARSAVILPENVAQRQRVFRNLIAADAG